MQQIQITSLGPRQHLHPAFVVYSTPSDQSSTSQNYIIWSNATPSWSFPSLYIQRRQVSLHRAMICRQELV